MSSVDKEPLMTCFLHTPLIFPNDLGGLPRREILYLSENISYLDWSTNITKTATGELGYDGPLYDGFLRMTDDMLGPNPMHIKYSSYVYDGFCI